MWSFGTDHLWLLDVGQRSSQPWSILLFIFLQRLTIVSPELALPFVMIQEAALVAKNGKAFILEGNPVGVQAT